MSAAVAADAGREPAKLAIGALDPSWAAAWDAFVEAHPEATFFHRAGWKRVLEQGLGHRAPFLLAHRDGDIEGVLPLGRVKSLLFGHALVSTPFCVYGGALANSEAARAALEAEAVRLAHAHGVDYLELRERACRHPDWPAKRDRYVTFRQVLDPDPDRNYQRIRRKQRAEIRKGIAAGLVAEIDDDFDRFYPVFAESVRNLGTPVFPLRYFRTLRAVFGSDCEILVVTRDGAPIAGVVSFRFRDEILPYHGGGVFAARAVSANDFMYWSVMRRAAEQGVRVFDFGRSKVDSGSYHFKRHWDFEPSPLHYEYELVRSPSVPDLSPMNPKYRAFIAAWRRLPLGVSRWLGPPLARHLG